MLTAAMPVLEQLLLGRLRTELAARTPAQLDAALTAIGETVTGLRSDPGADVDALEP